MSSKVRVFKTSVAIIVAVGAISACGSGSIEEEAETPQSADASAVSMPAEGVLLTGFPLDRRLPGLVGMLRASNNLGAYVVKDLRLGEPYNAAGPDEPEYIVTPVGGNVAERIKGRTEMSALTFVIPGGIAADGTVYTADQSMGPAIDELRNANEVLVAGPATTQPDGSILLDASFIYAIEDDRAVSLLESAGTAASRSAFPVFAMSQLRTALS